MFFCIPQQVLDCRQFGRSSSTDINLTAGSLGDFPQVLDNLGEPPQAIYLPSPQREFHADKTVIVNMTEIMKHKTREMKKCVSIMEAVRLKSRRRISHFGPWKRFHSWIDFHICNNNFFKKRTRTQAECIFTQKKKAVSACLLTKKNAVSACLFTKKNAVGACLLTQKKNAVNACFLTKRTQCIFTHKKRTQLVHIYSLKKNAVRVHTYSRKKERM